MMVKDAILHQNKLVYQIFNERIRLKKKNVVALMDGNVVEPQAQA